MRLLVLLSAAVLAGCSAGVPPQPNAVTVTALTRLTPEATLDAVAAWAEADRDLGAGRDSLGRVVVRDLRAGQENVLVAAARTRSDGATLLVLLHDYVVRGPRAFRHLPIDLFQALGEQRTDYLLLPVDGSEPCESVASWRDRPPGVPSATPDSTERQPVLIGGLGGLQRRVEYPEAMRGAGVEGSAAVSFVVGTEGAVECVNVVWEPHPDLGAAVRRAAEEAAFEPGVQRGEAVRVRFFLPVRFMLR